MDDGHARVKMDEVDRYLDQTWFSWIGGTQPDSAFYYRVHSPVVLIEFDHQQPANLRKFAADPTKPTQQHIHCVVRTPNGNAKKTALSFGHVQQCADQETALNLDRMSDEIGTDVSGVLGVLNLRTLDLTIDYRDGLVGFDFSTAPAANVHP